MTESAHAAPAEVSTNPAAAAPSSARCAACRIASATGLACSIQRIDSAYNSVHITHHACPVDGEHDFLPPSIMASLVGVNERAA